METQGTNNQEKIKRYAAIALASVLTACSPYTKSPQSQRHEQQNLTQESTSLEQIVWEPEFGDKITISKEGIGRLFGPYEKTFRRINFGKNGKNIFICETIRRISNEPYHRYDLANAQTYVLNKRGTDLFLIDHYSNQITNYPAENSDFYGESPIKCVQGKSPGIDKILTLVKTAEAHRSLEEYLKDKR